MMTVRNRDFMYAFWVETEPTTLLEIKTTFSLNLTVGDFIAFMCLQV